MLDRMPPSLQQDETDATRTGGLFLMGGVMMFFDRAMFVLSLSLTHTHTLSLSPLILY